jgi:L-2-hydroxycarboxylate dehydrogenase (NAD+)
LSRPGSLLPFGAAKGYCLSVLLEMMAAVLPGANTGVDVGWIKTEGMKENLGYMFIAIDVGQIRPLKEVEKDIEYYTTKLKNTEPAKGKSEVFLPGEIEHMNMKKRMQEGFNLNYNVAKDLLMLAKKYNRLDKDATIEDLFYIKKEV